MSKVFSVTKKLISLSGSCSFWFIPGKMTNLLSTVLSLKVAGVAKNAIFFCFAQFHEAYRRQFICYFSRESCVKEEDKKAKGDAAGVFLKCYFSSIVRFLVAAKQVLKR